MHGAERKKYAGVAQIQEVALNVAGQIIGQINQVESVKGVVKDYSPNTLPPLNACSRSIGIYFRRQLTMALQDLIFA